jgi:hypothetical protein
MRCWRSPSCRSSAIAAVADEESQSCRLVRNTVRHGEWSAAFWQYALAQPVEGHLFLDTPEFDFSSGQSGAFGSWAHPTVRSRARSHFHRQGVVLTLRDGETSSLEAPPFFGAPENNEPIPPGLPIILWRFTARLTACQFPICGITDQAVAHNSSSPHLCLGSGPKLAGR